MGDDTEQGARSGALEPSHGVVRPDALGEPRPPAAPRRPGTSYRYPTRVVHLDPHHPSRGWGIGPKACPPLEAVRVPRWAHLREALLESVYFIVFFVVAMVLYCWFGNMDVAFALWAVAVFVLLVVWWRWRACRSQFPRLIVAGSSWLGRVQAWRSGWLALYELAHIEAVEEADSGGDPIPGTVVLYLRDADSRELWVALPLLQTNPKLWDLVYQGITYSIAAGAQVTDEVRRALGYR